MSSHKGATVVAQRQTTGLQVAQQIVGPRGQIVEVDTATEIFRTLRTGLVAAAVTDLQLAQDPAAVRARTARAGLAA